MAIEFNDNFHVKINRPTDFRFGPFTDIEQANLIIPIAQRYHGLIFGVYTDSGNIATSDITFYYYWDGLTDTDIKPFSGSKWTDIGTDIYRNSKVLVGSTTFNDPTAIFEISGRVSQVGLSDSTYFGYQSGRLHNLSTNNNSAFGDSTLHNNTSGYSNVVMGQSAMFSNSTGYYNTAVGTQSLFQNSIQYNNTAVGFHAARNSQAYFTTAIGAFTLLNNTGVDNTAVGSSALQINTTGFDNTAVGESSLYSNTTGNNNSAFGRRSLVGNTTGVDNSGFGTYSLRDNNVGNSNCSFGYSTMILNKASFNSAFGTAALARNINGSNNTAIGVDAGRFIANGITALTNINNSVFVGAFTKSNGDTESNEIVIGHSAVGNGSNTTTVGNLSTVKTFLKGKLNIGALESPAVGAVTNIGIDTSGNIVEAPASGGSVGAGIGLSLVGTDIKLGDGSTLTYVDTPTVKDFFLYQVGTNNLSALYSGFGSPNPTLSEAGFATTNNTATRGAEIKTEYNSASPNPYAKIQINNGAGLFNVFSSDETNGYLLRDDIHQKGITETADYSANKTDFSYVTKKMLTDAIGGAVYTASNGLAMVGNDVRLGDAYITYTPNNTFDTVFDDPNSTLYAASYLNLNASDVYAGNELYNVSGKGGSVMEQFENATSGGYRLWIANGAFNQFKIELLNTYGGPTFAATVTDDINNKGLEEAADYSANKTENSYITPNWVKAQSGYNGAVAQYFTHDASGNFAWVNI